LMVAGLLAAYVSTISTHLNWGTSYLVHDVYRRFVKPSADERHYVAVGRLMTAVLMVIAAGLTFVLETAGKSFQLLLAIGAGTGLLYLLRWFWWRVSAWCEIAAMATSFALAATFFALDKAGRPVEGTTTLLLSVLITTGVWVLVAFVGPQTDRAVLERFYALVRPAGPGWAMIRERAKLPASPDSIPQQLLGWVMGIGFVYAALFGAGSALQGHTTIALVWGVVFVVTGIGLVRLLPSLWAGAADA
nr:Na+:solute symporter [Gemmatimonadaceae bacterium]